MLDPASAPAYRPGGLGRVAVYKSFGERQGDALVLYRNRTEDLWGLLRFGWGSCPGCDALQSCGDYTEIGQLIRELEQTIKWGSRQELLDFFITHDWKGDFDAESRPAQEFVRAATALLRAYAGGQSEAPE